MELNASETETAAIAELADLAEKNLPAQVITAADGRVFAIHRSDVEVRDISLPNSVPVPMPQVLMAVAQLQTSLALTQYLHRFKDADSMMFGDVGTNTVTAILDYHVRPTENVVDKGELPVDAGVPANKPAMPRRTAHRAVLKLRHSQEWMVWAGTNDKMMSHLAFSNFLEENAMDVIQPSGGALLEICKDLQVKGTADFKSSTRNGDVVSIEYRKQDDVSNSASIELPAEIMIAIPVYFGEEPITMNVLLRRKVEEGKLTLGIKIKRLENHKQDEFLRIVNEVSADTDVEVVLGNPA